MANFVHNSQMSIPEQQVPPIEERIGSMAGKIIVLALCALLLWGYSTTFLAQIGLFLLGSRNDRIHENGASSCRRARDF